MEMDNVIDIVRDYLDDKGYHYEYNAEHQFLQLGFGLKCKLKRAKVIVDFRSAGYLVYAISPINGDKDCMGELLKFVAMANYGLVNGNFDVDVRDGEIRYKCWASTWKLDAYPADMFDESLSVPLMMMERYGDGIAALALGFSDAETEIAKAERRDEPDDAPDDDD